MGIKGIYGEIGPGDRVSLAKLSIEKFEKTEIPLRIAIDISIWNFQIQSGQGGTNPALRTLYYRLLRLLSVSVQPLFVFDGPHKPPVKRNKRTGHGGASIPDLMTKELLKLFGFPYHIAPGEAEAECALLQREGVVDAVLSEDVDTLMFGSGLTFRNWSSETTKAKIPTHVNVYDAKATKEGKSGLDREGMILVALMSGGDYKTEGIPGCGVKVACEAARAGFGKSLCRISRADTEGYEAWRRNLAHEMRTNESKFFRIKRKAQQIPEDFPDRKVLGYYTHPVVSSKNRVQRMKDEIVWDGEIDVPKLRHFAADAFEWKGKEGAKKFVRGLAPVLLVLKLRLRGDRRSSGLDDLVLTKINEMSLVRSICGQRQHLSTDGLPEMRVIYHPLEIVDIDLDEEPDEDIDFGRDGLAPLLDDDQIEAYASDGAVEDSPRKRGPSAYDPEKADKLWVPETLVKVGVPLTAEDYAESLRDPKKSQKQKADAKRAASKKTAKTTGEMPRGAMDAFVQVSKRTTRNEVKALSQPTEDLEITKENLPPAFLAPALERPDSPDPVVATKRRTRKTATAKEKTQGKPKLRQNPWAASQSSSFQPTVSITKSSRISRPSTPTKHFPIYEENHSPEPSPIPIPLSAAKGKRKQKLDPTPKQNPLAISQQSSSKPTSPMNRFSQFQQSISPMKIFDAYSLSPSPEHNPRSFSRPRRPSTPTQSILSPSPRKESKKHNRESPDLSPRKRHSPPSRTPLTPQLVNRKIDFLPHSSPNSVDKSFSSYNTAPSQIIDLSSSPIQAPPDPQSPFQVVLALSSPLHSPSPYHLNSSTPIPGTSQIRNLAPQEKTYLKGVGLDMHPDMDININKNLNSSLPIPTRTEVKNLNGGEVEYLESMGISSKKNDEMMRREMEKMQKKENKRRYVMLRESLPGYWREVGREELVEGRSRAWRMEEVEVVDLT